MLDKVGKEIPKRLRAVFSRSSLKTLAAEYELLAKHVLERMDANDEMFKGIKRPTFEAIRSDIKSILGAEEPYAVCPFCDAVGCKACLGRGWLGKFRYDATASARKE